MCIHIYIYFLVTLTMTTTADVSCFNGAICLSLQNCPGLINLNLGSQILHGMLRGLTCEYDYNTAKYCCPPGFQDINITNHRQNLLPNTTVCGIQMNDRIIGGVQTSLDEHPWTVLILYKNIFHKILNIFQQMGFFLCGGTLISSRYVLTAAHCFKDFDITQDLFHIRLGEWNLTSRTDCQQDDCSPDPLNVNVENIIPHENYNSNFDKQNDIALVRLAQDVPFTDFVRPICLPIEPTLRINTFEGYDLETAGWGETETESSDIKLKVNLRVANTEHCKSIYMFQNMKITENQLCAGGRGGKDSCRGDSGGALMGQLGVSNNWMAVGIISFGPSPCGTTGWPGVYTKVTKYIDWILSTIRP